MSLGLNYHVSTGGKHVEVQRCEHTDNVNTQIIPPTRAISYRTHNSAMTQPEGREIEYSARGTNNNSKPLEPVAAFRSS